MSDAERNDVLEVLYGEDGDEARLDDAGRAELAKLRELRGVMREVGPATEHEPPDTMGILMAAARERVPGKRSLLDRMKAWLGVMIAHPAMSAAATVVVVAGVAGVLYVRGAVKSDVKERAEKDTAGEQTVASTGSGSAVAAGSGSGSSSGSAVVAYGAEVPKNDIAIPAVVGEPTPDNAKRTPPEEKAPARPAHHEAPKPASGGRVAGGDVDGLVAQQDEGEAVTLNDRGPAADDDRDASKTNTKTTSTTTEAPPPPPPPPAPTMPAPAADTAGAAAPEQRRHDLDPAILTQQARAAAKKKDCKTVEQLATRVIQLDEGYYRANFAPDTTIRANCDAATRK